MFMCGDGTNEDKIQKWMAGIALRSISGYWSSSLCCLVLTYKRVALLFLSLCLLFITVVAYANNKRDSVDVEVLIDSIIIIIA